MNIRFHCVILSVIATCCLSVTAFAQEYYGEHSCCDSYNFAHEYYGEHPCCDSCNPSNGGRFHAGADWLYWKATENGLNYAHFRKNTRISSTLSTLEQDTLKPHFKFNTGYRVYAGYEIPCSCWEVGIIYTHIPSAVSRSSIVATNSATGVTPSFTETITINDLSLLNVATTSQQGPNPGSIKMAWGLDFDYVDVDFGGTLCVCDYLSVSPHVGVRHLWAKQFLNANFPSTSGATNSTHNTLTGLLINRTNGTGAEAGLWGDWAVGCGFSIIGHVGGSILYGKHEIKGSNVLGVTTTTTTTTDVIYRDIEHTSISMMDYFIGLQYATCIYGFGVNLHVGWEQHVVYDMNRFTRTDGGDLSLQGLTLGGGFTF